MTTETRKFPEPQPFTEKTRPPIALQSVDSSQVKAVGYDDISQTLAVQFKHGAKAIYHYPDVEPATHAAFIGAESLGKFFRDNLKTLPFEKFPDEPETKAEEQSDVQAAAGGMTKVAVEA